MLKIDLYLLFVLFNYIIESQNGLDERDFWKSLTWMQTLMFLLKHKLAKFIKKVISSCRKDRTLKKYWECYRNSLFYSDFISWFYLFFFLRIKNTLNYPNSVWLKTSDRPNHNYGGFKISSFTFVHFFLIAIILMSHASVYNYNKPEDVKK